MLSKKILEIKSLTETICNLSKNDSSSTKLKVLYFIDEYQNISPQILIAKLGIVKSNLAIITKNLIKEELITSHKGPLDQRSVFYSITDKGKKMLGDYLLELDKILHTEIDDLVETRLDEVLAYLNKKV